MRGKRLIVTLLVAAGMIAAALIVPWVRKPAVLYEVTSFTIPGGNVVFPRSINDHGQVAGAALQFTQGVRQTRIFLWDPDTGPSDLVCFAGSQPASPILINNVGQVAGSVFDPNGANRCFLWDPNRGQQWLAMLSRHGSEVQALNNRGQAAGFSDRPAGARHAALWDSGGRITDLGTLGGASSFASGINDMGQVVGFSRSTDNQWHAFFWDPNAGMKDLGVAGPGSASPGGIHINNGGIVAGRFGSPSDKTLISMWSQAEGLRTLPSIKGVSAWPVALNDAGQLLISVRSACFAPGDRVLYARTAEYLWDPGKGFLRLHEGTVRGRIGSFQPRDINNRGQIVAMSDLSQERASQGLILEPVPNGGRK